MTDGQVQFWVDVALGLAGAVFVFVYRLHVRQYESDQKAVADKIEAAEKKAAKELATMQTAIEARIADVARVNERVLDALQTYTRDQDRRNDEFWKEINRSKEKAHSLELSMARAYHTKDEIAQLLDDKLRPIRDMVQQVLAKENA